MRNTVAVLILVAGVVPLEAQSPHLLREAIPRQAARLAKPSKDPSPPADQSWERLRSLTPGTTILLAERSRPTHEVHFMDADEDALRVREIDAAIPRQDVLEVSYAESHYGRKGALVGLGLGALMAVVSIHGSGCDRDPECAGYTAMLVPGLGAGIGAGIGAGMSAASHQFAIIYRAPATEFSAFQPDGQDSAEPRRYLGGRR